MKKRLMAALLCLCLLMGLLTAVAFASELEEIDPSGSIEMSSAPSTGSGSVIVDSLDSTSGDGYAVFNLDEAAEYAYTMGKDITAQAFDNAATVANKVYKVEIAWGDMKFAWGSTEEILKVWEPDSHSYSTDTTNTRTNTWYLLDETTPLTLNYDTDGSYSDVVSGTRQNYVLLFNHSNDDVNANVKIAAVNAPDANEGTVDDSIVALLKNEDGFGAAATVTTADVAYDYVLAAAAENSAVYANDATAAALYVEMQENLTPSDGALNNTDHRPVAQITVTLTVPGTEAPDVDQDASEA